MSSVPPSWSAPADTEPQNPPHDSNMLAQTAGSVLATPSQSLHIPGRLAFLMSPRIPVREHPPPSRPGAFGALFGKPEPDQGLSALGWAGRGHACSSGRPESPGWDWGPLVSPAAITFHVLAFCYLPRILYTFLP